MDAGAPSEDIPCPDQSAPPAKAARCRDTSAAARPLCAASTERVVSRPALHAFRYGFRAMGSPCELQGFARDRKHGELVAAAVEAEVARLEQRYSRYRDDSLLSHINHVAAAGGSLDVDAETAGLLDYSATAHAQSDGLFDITSGLLRRAWRFEPGARPDPERIADLLRQVGWHRLSWQRPRLTFPLPGMEIDLGGVVKEYAADRAATVCRAHGLIHACVNLGGDIRVVAPRPDGRPWIIGIRHPRQPEGVLANVPLLEGGIATSGDYERCIELDGQRFSHILDPRTGWPVQHLATVSVIADLCLVAGSASTIGMLKQADGAAWLADLGLPHVWMTLDGNSGGAWPHPD